MAAKIIKSSVIVLGIAVLLAGCAREVYDITWQGVVADETTGRPVPHAKISAAATYQQNIDETAEINRSSLCDEYGRFNLSFPRAFGLTVKVNAPGYLAGLQYKVVKKSVLKDTIFITPHPFDASLIVRRMNFSSFCPEVPFIRETRILDQSNGKNLVRWGFDFLSGQNTFLLDSADIWIEINEQSGRIILNASSRGGIFPVLNSSSEFFLTGITQAPETGYQKSYVLKGNEAGFFILCRNGVNVAKMIPEDKICVLSYTGADGQAIREKGIRFDYLFQPDLKNRLSFPVSVLGMDDKIEPVSN
ncbi:MAG: hypothetical protein JG782_669 [Anaerophaga sp.]|uniref:carboxypeptidase-like regulatory domain-containing protein n=1 Tax=Anaerophaga thermohalophila TaxID=177400 RepID=UPI000237CC89|nr:carboxypeptidase-like regulatory domain-containing protein [Anaerophaga thermohalophila]MBZ4676050.1 hypothetical protein [Anaerophaga sp.]MDN5290278.1 hypothetical protein [Anaerophaga sp.]